MALIQSDAADGIATITLDHQAKRNALSAALVEEILVALEEIRPGVRVAILRASADAKVWSAGHDVDELPRGGDPLLYSDPLERLIRAVRMFPAPIIAMVHGSVWGGATDLALNCDMIIADETSSFAITPANLGLPYNMSGLLGFMRRLPLNRVKEMFYTAAPFGADDAARWGIVNHLVPAAELEHFTYQMARLIASKAPLVVAAVKEQLRILADSHVVTPTAFERTEELRHQAFQSMDYQEGILAFHEKRKPRFTGM
jgi:methylmalonyl-CoA decarboxylase